MNRILSAQRYRFPNGTLLLCLAVIAALTHTANANDTVTLYGNAMFSNFPGIMLGGSAHVEHRVTPTQGLTLRAQGETGMELEEGARISVAMVLMGYRHHWGAGYLNIEAGYLVVRTASVRVEDDLVLPAKWDHMVDGQVAFGRRIGPIDIGLWNNVPISRHPAFGFGVYLGVAID